MKRLAVLVCAFWLTQPAPALACGVDTPCQVKNGRYLVRAPAAWDKRSLLPLVFHFPGYQMTADDMMRDKEALAVFDTLGVLVVAAEARGLVWNLPAWGNRERDEFAYVNAVLDDVERRFPIDPQRRLASGFSLGGSMVWYTACQGPRRFTAFIAFSGAFWSPEPTQCPNGPVSLFHIHGLSDDTVPIRGRLIRPGLHQGNVYRNLETLRRIGGCSEQERKRENVTLPGGPEGVACETDIACGSGQLIRACFHDGGHYVAGNWYRAAFAFLEQTMKAKASHAGTNKNTTTGQ